MLSYTAQVSQIDVSISNVRNQNDEGKKVADSIKTLTEAILAEKQLDLKLKEELIESLAFLANQVNTPAEQRQVSICKVALNSIGQTISTVANLATIWAYANPIITSFLINY